MKTGRKKGTGGIGAYGKKLVKLGTALQNERSSMTKISDLAFDAGLRLQFRLEQPPGAPEVSDDDLRALWKVHGGTFHGPNIEHGSIKETDLFTLLRTLLQ